MRSFLHLQIHHRHIAKFSCQSFILFQLFIPSRFRQNQSLNGRVCGRLLFSSSVIFSQIGCSILQQQKRWSTSSTLSGQQVQFGLEEKPRRIFSWLVRILPWCNRHMNVLIFCGTLSSHIRFQVLEVGDFLLCLIISYVDFTMNIPSGVGPNKYHPSFLHLD